jgi:archaellum component FlaD/FlaE
LHSSSYVSKTERSTYGWEEDIDIHDHLLDFMFLVRVRPMDEQVILERFTILEKEEEQEINYCNCFV